MAKRKRTGEDRTVLFIGNSFTARNDLPGMIAKLAVERGKTLRHRLISAGGASLRAHWNAGEATKAIREGGYDAVVLQEQSTLPVKNAVRMHENVRLFDGVINAAGAETVLYMTWARRNAPEAQKAIADAYISIGRELGAMVVPVGLAWQHVLHKHEHLSLHDQDQSHPTAAGTYLAACVFVAMIFRENPIGLGADSAGLDDKDRGVLQRAAWQVCRSAARKRESPRQ